MESFFMPNLSTYIACTGNIIILKISVQTGFLLIDCQEAHETIKTRENGINDLQTTWVV